MQVLQQNYRLRGPPTKWFARFYVVGREVRVNIHNVTAPHLNSLLFDRRLNCSMTQSMDQFFSILWSVPLLILQNSIASETSSNWVCWVNAIRRHYTWCFISPSGGKSHVYPGAVHTRFEHSIG